MKKAAIILIAFLFMGCSLNGQLQSSNETQWSAHYQAMYDRVQQTNPEMDHVLTFCKEMIRFAGQYEQNAMSREEFFAKQETMRDLLRQEDEYRRQVAKEKGTSAGPLEQYLASKQ